ncbi:hypothetical protein DLD99_18105 [Pseudomonas kribbensis]|uniref:Uncharacterized protein n=1 Tax=Pseudomonas kribbensis TaxID=1628086 RepID=A0A345RSP1_9PSED|nr:hypothetical protein DLD99_18105 [Pseudomonas kribbensis]
MACKVKAVVATESTFKPFKPAIRDSLSQQWSGFFMTSISASAVRQITNQYLFPCVATTPFESGILEQNNFDELLITDL